MNNSRNILILLFLLYIPLCFAQENDYIIKFELEDILSVTQINTQAAVNPGNILQLDELTNTIRFTAGIEGSLDETVHYNISGRYTSFQDGTSDVEIREGWISLGKDTSAMARIGKQKVSWGLGMVWAPTDYINNSVNAFDVDDPVEGRTMLYLEYPFNSGSISGVYLPDPAEDTPRARELKDAITALRFNVLWKEIDISLTSAVGPENSQDFGIAASYPVGSFILFAEVNMSKDPLKRFYYYTPDPTSNPYYNTYPDDYLLSAVVGGNRSIGENGFLVFELYYDEKGFERDDMDGYIELLELTASNPLFFSEVYNELLEEYVPARLAQFYAYASYTHTIDDIHSIGCSVIHNLTDSFMYLIPSYSYTGITDADLSLEMLVPAGNTDDGEGSLFMTHSVVSARLKVYF